MAKFDNLLVRAKFRGCMLGALVGDCLGAPFEGDPGSRVTVRRYFDGFENPGTRRLPFKPYTDDTAMTRSVARSLIEKSPFDHKHLARLFVKEYFGEPKRGYGRGVVEVFHKLRSNRYEDVFRPAVEQFEGKGSYGNGGAMRIAPVALFFRDNLNELLDAARKCTEITHTHALGVNGALLQALAVRKGFGTDPKEKSDGKVFTDDLIREMESIEESDIKDLEDPTPYQSQLKVVRKLLELEKPGEALSDDEVVAVLGNSISALHSVPTAIYCYLRAQDDIPGLEAKDIFRRTIQYAITLGGDTDTIAAMAGSIAGAHLGESAISDSLKKQCEFVDGMTELADRLFEASNSLG